MVLFQNNISKRNMNKITEHFGTLIYCNNQHITVKVWLQNPRKSVFYERRKQFYSFRYLRRSTGLLEEERGWNGEWSLTLFTISSRLGLDMTMCSRTLLKRDHDKNDAEAVNEWKHNKTLFSYDEDVPSFWQKDMMGAIEELDDGANDML